MAHAFGPLSARAKIGASVAVGLLLAGAAFSYHVAGDNSTAAFNDTTTKEANTFVMGTVSFDVRDGDDTEYKPLVAEVTDLEPGGSFFKSVLVKNTGSLKLRYAVSSTPTEFSQLSAAGTEDGTQLSKDVTVDVKTVPADSACNEAGWASGSDVASYGSFGGPAPTVGTEVLLIGDKAQGAQAGDRELDAGASELLCLRSSIALEAENNIQGATAVYNLEFNAEQTANNS